MRGVSKRPKQAWAQIPVQGYSAPRWVHDLAEAMFFVLTLMVTGILITATFATALTLVVMSLLFVLELFGLVAPGTAWEARTCALHMFG